MTRLHRTHEADLEIRSGGRVIHGIAVPFNAPTPIRDVAGEYIEVFVKGSFSKTIRERGHKVKALAQHNREALPLGRATSLKEDAAGLYVELTLSKTREADEVLELVRDGALDSFSIGFQPMQQRDGFDAEGRRLVTRTEVLLRECSVVAFPAFEGAAIAGVRAADPFRLNPTEALYKRLELLRLEA